MITIQEVEDLYRKNNIDPKPLRYISSLAPNEEVAMLCLSMGVIDLLPRNKAPDYWFNLVRFHNEVESSYLSRICSHLITAQAYEIILSHLMKCEEEYSDEWWRLALNRFFVQCEIMRMQTT